MAIQGGLTQPIVCTVGNDIRDSYSRALIYVGKLRAELREKINLMKQ